jgi:hypothetical protein
MTQLMESSIPPVGEIEKDSGNKFCIAAGNCSEIATASIKYFDLVPNYQKPSIFSMATVATVDGKMHHLIDGQHHFEAALREGQTTIMCRILTVPDDTDAVLAWLKSYVRTGAIDADASYAESGRNILINSELLIKDGYIRITPGGTWSPQQLKLNVGDKLADIFKRSTRTIKNYLYHFDFLNAELIERMVREEVPKSFFSAIESAKAKFIDSVASLHDERTLNEVVSAKVSEWLDNFDRKAGKVSSLVKSNGKKSDQKPAKNADTDSKKNGSIADVMGAEKRTEPAQTPNSGESVGEAFDRDHSSEGVAPETVNDKTDGDDRQTPKSPVPAVPLNLNVYQGGAKPPEYQGAAVCVSLNELADHIKEVVKRRPNLKEFVDEIQNTIDKLLDLKVVVNEKIDAEPYYDLGAVVNE